MKSVKIPKRFVEAIISGDTKAITLSVVSIALVVILSVFGVPAEIGDDSTADDTVDDVIESGIESENPTDEAKP